jgi:thiamine-phosphate pyrophosphorylase
MSDSRLRGLYAVTPEDIDDLAAAVGAVLRGGARIIQYRDKSADRDRRLDRARQLRSLCDAASALLIVNDDPALAAACGADGVHLGRGDGSIAAARELLGHDAIIGATCHDSLVFADEAQAAGADYLAFGAFFPSPTKPGATVAPVELMSQARARYPLPLCAIGGITADNGRALLDAGADMLAVSSGVFHQPDIATTAKAYAGLFPMRNG